MAHVPHVYLPGPWEGRQIQVPEAELHHLERVMRRSNGSAISYTDGTGVVGSGALHGGSVHRGDERRVAAPPQLTMAVAPPHSPDRVRFVVEKLAELGVARLVWLQTRFGQNRPPRLDKAAAWAKSALQQSRGAYLLHITGLTDWTSLEGPLVVARQHADGDFAAVLDAGRITLAVGPEGGFAEGEVPARATAIDLGPHVLRTETAALAGAATALWLMRRDQ